MQEEKTQKGEAIRFREKTSNKPDFFHTDEAHKEESTTIPGSSLRGVLRTLLEIVSYSKFEIVKDLPKMFYRAVAAPTDDSLGNLYKKEIKNIKAGYLKKTDDCWSIVAAKSPKDIWEISERKPYLTVKDEFVKGKIPSFLDYDHPNYKPQFHKISFEAEIKTITDNNGHSKKYLAITDIGEEYKALTYKGVLVCSGNMLENDSLGNKSPRSKHSIVLERTEEQIELKIQPQVIKDYKDALTPFLQEAPFDRNFGCLIDGNPVFFLEENNEVVAFGHTPNFRLPSYFSPENRASNPLDFVPPELRNPKQVDFAEAIFGFAKKEGKDKGKAFASRVYVTDAKLKAGQTNILLETIIPPILASPKPTAFQHYLAQASEKRESLKHYGSETPKETVLRGHKLYWHRGNLKTSDLRVKPNTPNVDERGKVDEFSKQHTQFRPVKPGVTFEFRLYFENLSNEELGALCWILKLQSEGGKTYYHKLGMGKALGMGAVELEANLFLEDRRCRYESLFNVDSWEEGKKAKSSDNEWRSFVSNFERKVCENISECESGKLADLARIKMLLKMLEWEENPDLSFKVTPNFEAEDNDFKARRVLPDPLHKKSVQTVRILKPPATKPEEAK